MNGHSVQEPGKESLGPPLAEPGDPQKMRSTIPGCGCGVAAAQPGRRGSTRWTAAQPSKTLRRAGLYAIFTSGQLAYIGSALNVRERIREWHLFNRWQRRHCPFGPLETITLRVSYTSRRGEHLAREARLIHRLKPPFNTTHAQRPRRPRR